MKTEFDNIHFDIPEIGSYIRYYEHRVTPKECIESLCERLDIVNAELKELKAVSAEDAIFNRLQAAAKKAALSGLRTDLHEYLKLRSIVKSVSITDFMP